MWRKSLVAIAVAAVAAGCGGGSSASAPATVTTPSTPAVQGIKVSGLDLVSLGLGCDETANVKASIRFGDSEAKIEERFLQAADSFKSIADPTAQSYGAALAAAANDPLGSRLSLLDKTLAFCVASGQKPL